MVITDTAAIIFIIFGQLEALFRASLVAQRLKRLPAMQETWVRSLGQEVPLEKEMTTHFSILAWRIPRMEEPGGLQFMGSQSWTRLSDFSFKNFLSFLSRTIVMQICLVGQGFQNSASW